MANPIIWIELPVTDMDRAITFYNAVFGFDLKVNIMDDLQMTFFPNDRSQSGASGALVKHDVHYTPSITGSLVYFNCEDCKITLDKVLKNGGKILQAKKQISENGGFMGLFLDSEGNRVAVYSLG